MADLPRPVLAPSLLAADHGRLAEGARAVADAGLAWLHLDLMDGHFVPNLSFGPQTVADLRRATPGLFFDVHLMLSRPQDHLDAFLKAGADLVTVHVEADHDVAATLARIRAAGIPAGISLNPGTPVDAVDPFLADVDLVLVMTVQPGFGGQSFREERVPAIAELARRRRDRGFGWRLEVDGGVDARTLPLCRAAGADTFVAGSAWFRADAAGRARLRDLAEG